MAKTGVIYGINGPIVHIKGDVGLRCMKWSMSEKTIWLVR